MKTFYQILTEAVNDIMQYGYDSQKRVDGWATLLKQAAIRELMTQSQMQSLMERHLKGIYTRLVTNRGIEKNNSFVKPYSINRLKPTLRAELDRRMAASKALIDANRESDINDIIQRFRGFATSVPKGGSDVADKTKVKQDIKKPLQSTKFKERRVTIDQGHKLSSVLNEIVCVDSGAIAGVWHSTHQVGYNNRKDHLSRDGKTYVIKNGWAYQKGLIKAPDGFTDDITMPGEEVFCRCRYQYVFALSDLPTEMLTKKGLAMVQSK